MLLGMSVPGELRTVCLTLRCITRSLRAFVYLYLGKKGNLLTRIESGPNTMDWQ